MEKAFGTKRIYLQDGQMSTFLKQGGWRQQMLVIWRRSFDIQPPAFTEDDERNPKINSAYRNEDVNNLPLTESLTDTIARVVPYFENVIKKDMEEGKRVLIVAHGNSLRALVKYFEKISDKEIVDINIPTGIPLVYEFNNDFKVINKYYLGDESAINEKMNNVAN